MKLSNFHWVNCNPQFPSAHILHTSLVEGQKLAVEMGDSKESRSNCRRFCLSALYPGFPLSFFIWDENLYPGQCARLCQHLQIGVCFPTFGQRLSAGMYNC